MCYLSDQFEYMRYNLYLSVQPGSNYKKITSKGICTFNSTSLIISNYVDNPTNNVHEGRNLCMYMNSI